MVEIVKITSLFRTFSAYYVLISLQLAVKTGHVALLDRLVATVAFDIE